MKYEKSIETLVSAHSIYFLPEDGLIPPDAKWNTTGITVIQGNRSGTKLEQMINPTRLYLDDDGSFLIITRNDPNVFEWIPGAQSGKIVAGVSTAGDLPTQLNSPTSVTVDKKTNTILICDSDNQRVVRWPRRNGTTGEVIINSIICVGLAIDDENFLYVTDYGSHSVKKFRIGDEDWTVVAGGNGEGGHLNQCGHCENIFVDKDHNVYTSDRRLNRVMKWIKGVEDAIVVAGGYGHGSNLWQLSSPSGIFVDSSGTVYVADVNNLRIMRWVHGAKQGSIIAGGNGYGNESNQLWAPDDVTLDQYGNLYVADYRNDRIQKFSLLKNENGY